MNRTIILGAITNKKTQLLLYIARAIQLITKDSVCLVSGNQHYLGDYNPCEYLDGLDVFVYKNKNDLLQINQASYGTILFDLDRPQAELITKEQSQNTTTFVIADQSSESIAFNFKIIHELGKDINLYLMCYQVHHGSKISYKTLRSLYGDEASFLGAYAYYFDQKDEVILIDNAHNDSLKMKHLSKEFKTFLLEVVGQIRSDHDDVNVKKALRLLKGGQ